MTKEEAEREIGILITSCRVNLETVARLANEHKIEGFELLHSTWHFTRERYDEIREILHPGWYDDEYWMSSTADCEVDVKWNHDEDEP